MPSSGVCWGYPPLRLLSTPSPTPCSGALCPGAPGTPRTMPSEAPRSGGRGSASQMDSLNLTNVFLAVLGAGHPDRGWAVLVSPGPLFSACGSALCACPSCSCLTGMCSGSGSRPVASLFLHRLSKDPTREYDHIGVPCGGLGCNTGVCREGPAVSPRAPAAG